MVHGDTRRLERVLENLLGNAVKHTPRYGRVTIAVGETPPASASVGRGEVGSATVTIHNSGSWIPAEDLSHIFERFYQVDKSRVGSSEGSGLGLAIARELVQAHGGRIVAASSRADGTRFTIHLPAIPALDPTKAGALGSGPTARRESSAGAVGVS
jgi:two-component system sensor histidine kinase BaeS